MKKLERQFDIGMRWLRCGWRLLQRNPYILLGMALVALPILLALGTVPLFGNVLVALVVPVFVSSAVLVADELSRQKMALPASLRTAALMRAPKELFRVFADEDRLFPMLVLCLYVMAVALLATISAHLLTGGAWASVWASLGIGGMLKVSFAWLLVLIIYFLIATSLVYAIPLAFLHDEPLVPAIGHSFRTSAKHMLALAVIFGLLLVPFAFGKIVLQFSAPAGYVVWFLGGIIALPLTITSCYCSYRTAFPTKSPAERQ